MILYFCVRVYSRSFTNFFFVIQEQTVFDSNEEDLETQRAQLLAEVEKAEEEVESLKSKLAQRKSKREYQAGIFKLTPEERANAMEVDDEEEGAVNMDVIL